MSELEPLGCGDPRPVGGMLIAAGRECLRKAQPILLIVALGAACLSLYTWAGDGDAAGHRAPVLARSPLGPLSVAVGAMVLALLAGAAPLRRHACQLWPRLERLAPGIVCVVAAAVLWFVWHHGVFVAAGADDSGYLSQASLWARGSILAPADPLARLAPWPDAEWTFTPLGYIPARDRMLAPSYPPGLPLLMAAAQRVAGPSAVFAVVPLAGLLLLVSVYSLGRRLAGAVAGAMASAVVASSPIVLMLLLKPMSDLPAAALWVAASATMLRASPAGALLAGLLAALAILVRPNLALLALPLILFGACRASGGARSALRLAAAFALGMLPGLALIAAIHATLYGSPLRSGYGLISDVYAWRHAVSVLTLQPARALATHTPLLALALGAPLVLRRAATESRALSATVFLLAMAGTAFLCYLFYPPFDAWWYLRFVVSSIVWLLVLACAVLVRLVSRLPAPVRGPSVALVGSLLVGLLLQRAVHGGVWGLPGPEQRYVTTARWVSEHLPEEATLICMQHSGSLRYYTGRFILRWDLLPPHKLDRALRYLREHGRSPYVVLDCVGETRAFAVRFHDRSELSQLDWPARAQIGRGACVRVFDPADRARYRAGGVLYTERLD